MACACICESGGVGVRVLDVCGCDRAPAGCASSPRVRPDEDAMRGAAGTGLAGRWRLHFGAARVRVRHVVVHGHSRGGGRRELEGCEDGDEGVERVRAWQDGRRRGGGGASRNGLPRPCDAPLADGTTLTGLRTRDRRQGRCRLDGCIRFGVSPSSPITLFPARLRVTFGQHNARGPPAPRSLRLGG